MSMLDLRKADLQVQVHRSLWPYQAMLIDRQKYCLSHMGFGLNVAPSIMQTNVDAILMKNECIQWATSAYIDDVHIDECRTGSIHEETSQQLWSHEQRAGEAK